MRHERLEFRPEFRVIPALAYRRDGDPLPGAKK